jgi:hypothetical protein
MSGTWRLRSIEADVVKASTPWMQLRGPDQHVTHRSDLGLSPPVPTTRSSCSAGREGVESSASPSGEPSGARGGKPQGAKRPDETRPTTPVLVPSEKPVEVEPGRTRSKLIG